jgi:hypothetical protein
VLTSDEYVQTLLTSKDVLFVEIKTKEALRQKILGFFGECATLVETYVSKTNQEKKHAKFSAMH